MPVDPLLRGLISGFATESRELCQKITRDLLALEKPTDQKVVQDAYHSLARQLHTLKGSAATLGLEELSEVAHRMEDLVQPLRQALVPVPATMADAMLRTLDVFLSRVDAHADGKDDLPSIEPTLHLLDSAKPAGAPAAGGEPAAAPAQAAAPAVAPTAPAAAPPPPAPHDRGPANSAVPEQSHGHGSEDEGSWRVNNRQVTALMRDVERLRELRLRLDDRRRMIEKVLAIKEGDPSAQLEAIRTVLSSSTRMLTTDSEEAADIVASLEEGLKAICTLPLRTITDPLQRTVRDLCRQFGKEAKLSVVGAELALDRRLLESLKGPLIHLIRNSLDHGLESPQEREKAGKHHVGALVIRVEQLGNVLFLEVSDDGRGIDLRRVKEEAKNRGVASAEELEAMTPAQLQQIIFRPGFSTKREISEISGRGVGLDVVLSQVNSLDGQIEVHSVAGQGTRFILNLPAELGSSPVLLLRVGDTIIGLPMTAVETARALKQDNLSVGRSRMHLEHEGELLLLQDLGVLLGLRQPSAPAPGQPVCILQTQGKRMALAVDEILGQDELVIRPLPKEVRDVPAYQGAATLARGELLLIVRPIWLIDNTSSQRVQSNVGTRRALVVDDSLTARALHRTMLEAGGYVVHTASNASQALDQVRRSNYDVMLCDIGMEEMDGITLTAAMRSNPGTRNLPIILVSALEGEVEKKKGMAAGADGFLSKKDCVSGRLLSEVSAVIARRKANG
ncbi:MAG TPA: response regulator [Myxococcaceae bacterium]|nr:response regulator [Myxococcaceae bacterium]